MFEVVCLLFDWLRVTLLLSSVEPLWYLSLLDWTWSSFVSLVGVWFLLDLRDDSAIICCFCTFVKIDGCVGDLGSLGVCEREPQRATGSQDSNFLTPRIFAKLTLF